MPNYRRALTPGGTWFFTVNLLERDGNDLLTQHVDLLRIAVAAERARRPFAIRAWVILPEHMHWIWTLAPGDSDFPTRWRRIKTHFSSALPRTEQRTQERIARGERGIWQRRYWEHQIRDERDLEAHLDYIHYNSVKHGWVTAPLLWPHSSLVAMVERGVYPANWTLRGVGFYVGQVASARSLAVGTAGRTLPDISPPAFLSGSARRSSSRS